MEHLNISDLGSQTISFFPDGVFLELGHLRYHHIPDFANLSAFLQIFKVFSPQHHHDVTKNMIRQIADEDTFSDIPNQRSSTGGHFDRISETQDSTINDNCQNSSFSKIILKDLLYTIFIHLNLCFIYIRLKLYCQVMNLFKLNQSLLRLI